MEWVVVGGWAEVEAVETGRVLMDSGCGSAGSLSAGLLFRRDVFCAEEVAVDSGDAGRWRLGGRVGGYVLTWPLVLVWFCRSCVGDGRGGVGGRLGNAVRVGLVDLGSPWTCG